MTIWVDADACPVAIKEILFRAAERTKTDTILVANQPMRTPNGRYVRSLKVSSGFDVADDEIVRRADAGDLIITSDIPLAAEVIEKDCLVLSPRGEWLDKSNVRQRLNIRDFMDTMRASGAHTGGPPPLGQADKQAFANKLDTYLTRSKTAD